MVLSVLSSICVFSIMINAKYNTPSGLYYKKHLTFYIHCVNDVSSLYL